MSHSNGWGRNPYSFPRQNLAYRNPHDVPQQTPYEFTGVLSTKAHISNILSSSGIVEGDISGNFQKLREVCGLTEGSAVADIVAGFSIPPRNRMSPRETIVDKNTEMIGLILYRLIGDADGILITHQVKKFLWTFFGKTVCTAATNGGQYKLLGELLRAGDPLTVTIRKPTCDSK